MTAEKDVLHCLAGVTLRTYMGSKVELSPQGSFAGAVFKRLDIVQDDHDHWVTPDVRAPLGSWSLSFWAVMWNCDFWGYPCHKAAFPIFSISAIAPAGARILPSWIT